MKGDWGFLVPGALGVRHPHTPRSLGPPGLGVGPSHRQELTPGIKPLGEDKLLGHNKKSGKSTIKTYTQGITSSIRSRNIRKGKPRI